MTWMKMRRAAAYAQHSTKLLYAAARSGRLRVVRIGAGRNMLTSDVWLDEYLAALETASERLTAPAQPTGTGSKTLSMRADGRSA